MARSKIVSTVSKLGTYFSTDNPSTNGRVYNGTSMYSEKRLLASSGHYGYPNFPPASDVGGAFVQEQRILANTFSPSGTVRGGGLYNTDSYVGSFQGNLSLPTLPSSTFSGIKSPGIYGARAYSAMKPTKPDLSLANSIFELKDLPSMLRQRFLDRGLANFFGSSYLAYQFGWAPLATDIANLVLKQQQIADHLKQLLRDNGKPVRRRWKARELDPVVTTQVINTSPGGHTAPVFVSQFYSGNDTGQIVTRTFDEVWASAQFRYWLPAGVPDIVYKRRIKALLHGLYISPGAVYRMIPWTWMIDWFLNAAQVLDNMDPGVADRLAADHFYVMRYSGTIVTKDITSRMRTVTNAQKLIPVSSYSEVSTKVREKGDPFGFGSSYSTLSATQLGIAGALGLSRLG